MYDLETLRAKARGHARTQWIIGLLCLAVTLTMIAPVLLAALLDVLLGPFPEDPNNPSTFGSWFFVLFFLPFAGMTAWSIGILGQRVRDAALGVPPGGGLLFEWVDGGVTRVRLDAGWRGSTQAIVYFLLPGLFLGMPVAFVLPERAALWWAWAVFVLCVSLCVWWMRREKVRQRVHPIRLSIDRDAGRVTIERADPSTGRAVQTGGEAPLAHVARVVVESSGRQPTPQGGQTMAMYRVSLEMSDGDRVHLLDRWGHARAIAFAECLAQELGQGVELVGDPLPFRKGWRMTHDLLRDACGP